MKLYGNNRQLAEQLLETAFSILRNEGLQPADCLASIYGQLHDGIDVSPAQQAALRACLRRLSGKWRAGETQSVSSKPEEQ